MDGAEGADIGARRHDKSSKGADWTKVTKGVKIIGQENFLSPNGHKTVLK